MNTFSRKYPLNMILLTLLMIIMGGIVAISSAFYREDAILIAGGQPHLRRHYTIS